MHQDHVSGHHRHVSPQIKILGALGPNEAVAGLPCHITYQMLKSATGVHTQKASSGDKALRMVATTVNSAPCLLNTAMATLMDLMGT